MSNQAFENVQGALGGLVAGAAIGQRTLVKMDTTAGQVVAAGLGEEAVGALRNATTASGEPVSLPRVGDIMVCTAGGALTAGGRVMAGAGGKVVDAVAGAPSVGFAVTSATADGDWVSVLFAPGVAGTSSPSTDGFTGPGAFRATYDVSGGDSGAIGVFQPGLVLPDNAVITRAYYYVETTFTSATDAATISIGIETDDVAGILAAVAISDVGNPFDAGWHEGIQDGTAAAFSEATTTATRNIDFTVAVEALTAGKLILFGDYIIID